MSRHGHRRSRAEAAHARLGLVRSGERAASECECEIEHDERRKYLRVGNDLLHQMHASHKRERWIPSLYWVVIWDGLGCAKNEQLSVLIRPTTRSCRPPCLHDR